MGRIGGGVWNRGTPTGVRMGGRYHPFLGMSESVPGWYLFRICVEGQLHYLMSGPMSGLGHVSHSRDSHRPGDSVA